MLEATKELDRLNRQIASCRECQLGQMRSNAVPGEGPADATIMFIGEAPGFHEDRQGRPFVGAAGKFLDQLLASIGLDRSDVFIANVIKCRPPQNRNPTTDEIHSCQPFLERQIQVIRPKVLVGLGLFACQWLLKTAEPMGRLRGRLGEYEGITVMSTYHPAYLLRSPSAKKHVWKDMKVVRSLL